MASHRIMIAVGGWALAAGLAPAALAQDASGIVALSPEERAEVLDAAARRHDESLPINGAPDGRPHGEAGFMIGTGGQRALFGSTVVPLGQDGYAAFSFMTAQDGRFRR